MLDLDFDFDFDLGDHFMGGKPDAFGGCFLVVFLFLAIGLIVSVISQNLPLLLAAVFLFLTILFSPKSKNNQMGDFQKLLLVVSLLGFLGSSVWGVKVFQDYQARLREEAYQRELEEQKQEELRKKLGAYNRAKQWLFGTNSPEPVTTESAPLIENSSTTAVVESQTQTEEVGLGEKLKRLFR